MLIIIITIIVIIINIVCISPVVVQLMILASIN